jgi:hypothetical protein
MELPEAAVNRVSACLVFASIGVMFVSPTLGIYLLLAGLATQYLWRLIGGLLHRQPSDEASVVCVPPASATVSPLGASTPSTKGRK